jgi:hypothetical protein
MPEVGQLHLINMHGLVDLTFKKNTMKLKFIISLAFIFLGFNSCKKIREKVFSTRMEGKVIDMQTGKGIPNARLVVYESQARQGSSNRNFYTLKTFYADQDGNFKDKIKISFTEEDDSYKSYFLKAEPDGYEKTEGRDCYLSGCDDVPYINLNLTKANKNLEFKCNPEFTLEINLIDEPPFFNKTFMTLNFKMNGSFFDYLDDNDNGIYNSGFFVRNDTVVNSKMPYGTYDLILKSYDQSINPTQIELLDSIRVDCDNSKSFNIKF